MICSPCNGYADLGFEAGRHYVQAEPTKSSMSCPSGCGIRRRRRLQAPDSNDHRKPLDGLTRSADQTLPARNACGHL